MTPEQRAARLIDRMCRPNSERGSYQDAIARAIRAAENAALERAALIADRNGVPNTVGKYIRSFKTRAPRRRTR